jgi:hypothetical protein
VVGAGGVERGAEHRLLAEEAGQREDAHQGK